jgi:biopolymer transport protein ExbD
MNWQVRHEGSPQSVELPLEQISQGVLDGVWEPTDEVKAPGEAEWVPIEERPELEAAAAEVDPPPPRGFEDEARLDMTALIDVCLVLLVFFILTTAVAALQKRLEAPTVEEKDKKKLQVATFTKEVLQQQVIWVKVTMENDEPVIRVEDQVVAPDRLMRELKRFVARTRKTDLLIDHDRDVPHGAVVQVIDAARGADINKVRFLVP